MARQPRLNRGGKSAFRMPTQPFCPKIVDSHSVASSAFSGLSPPAPGHIGTALGEMAANRRIRSRVARYRRPGTATSANWNVTYRAWYTTLPPILTSLSRGDTMDSHLLRVRRVLNYCNTGRCRSAAFGQTSQGDSVWHFGFLFWRWCWAIEFRVSSVESQV